MSIQASFDATTHTYTVGLLGTDEKAVGLSLDQLLRFFDEINGGRHNSRELMRRTRTRVSQVAV